MYWNIHHRRLTAFLMSPVDVSNISWWEDTFDTESTGVKITSMPLPVREEEGLVGDLILLLKVELTRVDWILSSSNKQGMGEFPNLGDADQAFDAFLGVSNKWFESEQLPKIKRLAFGSRFQREVDARSNGYDELDNYLHFNDLDTKNSSDFLYQINRPRQSKIIKERYINRISKWHVVNAKLLAMDTSGTYQGSIASDIYATTLDLDLSLDADNNSELPKNKLTKLFEELITLGKEIGEEGDIK